MNTKKKEERKRTKYEEGERERVQHCESSLNNGIVFQFDVNQVEMERTKTTNRINNNASYVCIYYMEMVNNKHFRAFALALLW